MSERDPFEVILESLYRAMLEADHWPRTSALIEEACGAKGSSVGVGEGPKSDVRPVSFGLYSRGQRREEAEHEYMSVYHRMDESVPRFRLLPFGHIVTTAEVYSEEELKTSSTYNEYLRRVDAQNGLRVRLEGPEGCSHVTWGLNDPVEAGSWRHDQLALMRRLLPHVRQFAAVRQALADSDVMGSSLSELLEARRLGVISLDGRGRILSANDRARHMLRNADGLSDRSGNLRAPLPADRHRLRRLLADALPPSGRAAIGGSMRVGVSALGPRFVVHVKPVVRAERELAARRRAALVLIVDPDRRFSIDPGIVAATLGLTAAESRVACWLAEGLTVREIAAATGRQKRSVYWHLEQMFAKLGVRRQVDLVRLVLAVADFI